MEKEERDRLIGHSIISAWDTLGVVERNLNKFCRIFVPFVAGLFAGYAWALYHASLGGPCG